MTSIHFSVKKDEHKSITTATREHNIDFKMIMESVLDFGIKIALDFRLWNGKAKSEGSVPA